MSGTSVSQSAGFFTTTATSTHRTGAVTDDHERFGSERWIVRRLFQVNGADDLIDMVLGDGEE